MENILQELQKHLNNFLDKEVFILHFCSSLMMFTGCLVYVILFFQPATYGRYSNATGNLLFCAIPARTAWFLQEVPAFMISIILVFLVILEWLPGGYTRTQLFVLSWFICHYFQRSFIYSLSITGGKPTPFYAFFLAFVFCTGNGYMQARGALLLSDYPDDLLTKLRVTMGFVLFCLGMYSNMKCDHMLRNLRKPGETGYKIPRGFLFDYISCGNFFGEIIEWIGFAIASWSSVSSAFAFFTIANLVPRAVTHHRFYHQKFNNIIKMRLAS
ncbi:3-oxo-5-alpha-steroid 4-dehydrogenase 1-like [Clytia hemisphaerica]